MPQSRRPSLLVVAALVVVLVGVGYLRRAGRTPVPLASAPTTAPSVSAAPAAPPRGAPRVSPEARRARDAMRADILEALRRRDAGAPAPSSPPRAAGSAAKPASPGDEASERGSYEASYIRDNFREQIFPLIRGCYEAALERKPKLSGKLVFSFRIVGDPSVGGVVEDSDFADESDIKDSEMETCTRESVMSLTFDKPPSGGGYVTVKYPVEFAPGEDDEADAGDAGSR